MVNHLFGVDPFSKITIKSVRARCVPVEASKTLLLTYSDSVVIRLADDSLIITDELKVTLEKNIRDKDKTEKDKDFSQVCKNFSLVGRVCLRRGKQEIYAHRADVDLKTNLCTLLKDVRIVQHGLKQESNPVEVTSSQATYNFKTEELVLVGSSKNPVSTTLLLGKNNIS
jgi:lipopolysaccharide export system protein LptA